MLIRPQIAAASIALLTATVLSACGGGGSNEGSSPPPTASTPGFNQARAFDNAVTGIVPAADGTNDVFVVGEFTTYNNVSSNRVIRLRADGTVAQAFPDGFNDAVVSLVSARDNTGAMYALGSFTQFNGEQAGGLVRLNRDGSRDTSFHLAPIDQPPTAMAVIPDASGALYIGGPFTQCGGTAIRHLAKLRADGTLDASFNPGVGFTGINDGGGPDSIVMTVAQMAVEETGTRRVYVTGVFGTYRGTSVPGFVRILPTGDIDPTYMNGGGGVAGSLLTVETLLPTANGKLYVGGRAVSQGLARLTQNGSVDRSFMPPPLITLMIGSTGDGTGDIYVSGFESSDGVVTYRFRRLRADGSRSPTFQEPTINAQVQTVVAVGDGSSDIYAGGPFTAYARTGVNHFARVHNDATLAGQTVLGSGFSYDVIDLEAGDDGRVYVVTLADSYNGTAIRPVVRLLPNGTLDPTFSFRQEVVPGTGVFIKSATRARHDSRLYISGSFTQYDGTAVASIVRLFQDGSMDRSFVTGRGFTHGGGNEPIDVVAPTVTSAASPAGTVYAFGEFTSYNGTEVPTLVRLTPSGALDPAFAIGSGFGGAFTGNAIQMVIPNADGTVYVSGFFETFNGQAVRNIVRLDSTGRLDPTFVPPETVQAFAAAPDGSVFVNTPNTSEHAVLRKLRPDGSVDTSFTSDPLPGGVISDVLLLSNGRIAVTGVTGASFTVQSKGYVTVLDQGGRQDAAFGVRTTGDILSAFPILVEADDGTGDIYLGGAFTRYEHQTMQRIARLNPSGAAE